jgi:hypothetical protein
VLVTRKKLGRQTNSDRLHGELGSGVVVFKTYKHIEHLHEQQYVLLSAAAGGRLKMARCTLVLASAC